MSKYRKKPVEIEAFHLGYDHLPDWFVDRVSDHSVTTYSAVSTDAPHRIMAVIRTLEGDMKAEPGDWIIKGVAGELYPCKDEIFRATYEALEQVEGDG